MKTLSYPFRFSGGTVATTTDYNEIVRGQIIDCVTTARFERVMRPDYGADAARLLFDPSDALVRADAATYIKTQLTQQVPRATVVNVDLAVDPSSPNIVLIKIDYVVRFVEGSLVVGVAAGGSNG